MTSISSIILCLFLPAFLLAQSDYVEAFDRLTDYNTSNVEKKTLSDQLTQDLVRDLGTQDFILDSLGVRQLKTISSDDGALSITTWHYKLSDATSQYGGIVVHEGDIFPLQFNDIPIVDDEEYNQDNWCGGVYFDIIPVKKKGKTLYTLLAWDGNNGIISKKIIDVLSFDRRGRPIFGLPIFEEGRMTSRRVIIDYPASNTMLLEFDADQKAIISNALFANDDKFADVPEYYSVSDGFNVFRYEDSKWVFYADVDLRLNKKESKALQNNAARPSSGL